MDQKEIKSLIKLLDDPDQEVSRHVEDRLLSYGSEVVRYLENAWEHSLDTLLQHRIEAVVHKIQFRSTKEELKSWISHGSFDLLQGLIIINKFQYPDLDAQRIINQIETIKRDIWMQMSYDMNPLEKVKMINHVLYTTYGFSGNTINHKDPQNSYLSQVLETRKGNQISLAVIYLIVAHKLDIPIYGVNLPQHFILAFMDDDKTESPENRIQFYINAFNKGFIFGRDEVDSFLKQLNIKPEKHFYEPCSNQDIIKRVIRNLMSAYQNLTALDKVNELGELLELF